MPNLCPICQTPIRKNAKHCTLHAAQHGMQFVKVYRGAPCARLGCTGHVPKGWKPRVKGSTPRIYCSDACRIQAKKERPSYLQSHRAAQAKYMAAVRELERRQRQRTAA